MEIGMIGKSAVSEAGEPSGSILLALVLIITAGAFVFGDTAVVAWFADVVTTAEVIAYGLAFALISIALLVTAGNLRRLF